MLNPLAPAWTPRVTATAPRVGADGSELPGQALSSLRASAPEWPGHRRDPLLSAYFVPSGGLSAEGVLSELATRLTPGDDRVRWLQ
jgi:hypothetical protein